MINDSTIKSIGKLISSYEYGQFNLLDDPISMEYESLTGKISFQNFYKHDYLLNKDTCLGLMSKAYSDIRLTHRNLFVARAFGKDDAYFKFPNSNHCFLLVNDIDMMNYCSVTDDKSAIIHALNTNPIIVDPSFKRIIPASESRYIIDLLMNHSQMIDYKNSQTLTSEDGKRKYLPLVLNDAEEILYILPDLNSDKLSSIGIQQKNMRLEDISTYDVDSKKLDELYKHDKKSYQFIEYFRNIPIIRK